MGRRTQTHADCCSHLLRARRTEGHPDWQRWNQAERDRHRSTSSDREDAEQESFPRALCESTARMAQLTPFCGRDRLAQTTGGPDRTEQVKLLLHCNLQRLHLSIEMAALHAENFRCA